MHARNTGAQQQQQQQQQQQHLQQQQQHLQHLQHQGVHVSIPPPPTTAAPVSLSAGSDVAPLIPPVLQLLLHCMPVHSMAQTQAQAEAATAMSAGRTGTGRFAGTDNFTGVSSLAGQQQQQCTTPQDVQQQQQQRQQRQRQQQEAVAAHIQSLLAGIRVPQQQQQTSNLELLSSSVGVLDLLKRMEDKGQQQDT